MEICDFTPVISHYQTKIFQLGYLWLAVDKVLKFISNR